MIEFPGGGFTCPSGGVQPGPRGVQSERLLICLFLQRTDTVGERIDFPHEHKVLIKNCSREMIHVIIQCLESLFQHITNPVVIETAGFSLFIKGLPDFACGCVYFNLVMDNLKNAILTAHFTTVFYAGFRIKEHFVRSALFSVSKNHCFRLLKTVFL